MKTGPGRSDFYLPSASTVGRDVRTLFVATRKRIALKLQVSTTVTLKGCITYLPQIKNYPGSLSFATDAWTSPNDRPFVTFTVHLELNQVPTSILLDIVELLDSHTGQNLAQVFANVLKDFSIEDKVSARVMSKI